MPRRRVTVGRAFALLLAGIGIGASIFLAKRLRPEALKQEVERAIRDLVAGTFTVGEVVLDLDRGVELVNVALRYPDGSPALEAERVAIAVDQRQLLAGDVEIRQIDLYGARFHMRGHDGTSWRDPLAGILQSTGDSPLPKDFRLPVLRIRPGNGGSAIELMGTGVLAPSEAITCVIRQLDAYPEGSDYRVLAELGAERITSARLEGRVSTRGGTMEASLRIEGFRFERRDVDLLAPETREALPPVELSGRAFVEMKAVAQLSPFRLTETRLLASLSELEGAFGNLHTGEPAGLPFGLDAGTGTLTYHDGQLDLPDLRAEYVSPEGVRGAIGVALGMNFARPGNEVDFTLRGRGVRASTKDLHLLIEPEIVESIVDPYRPAGTFDFEISVSRRLGLPEKVTADLRLSDGAFNYTGRLDELTGRRFGFQYPLERCSGHILIETNVPTPRGLAQITHIREIRGSNRIARPREGGAEDVRIEAEGRITAYLLPGESPPEDVAIRILVHDLPIDAKLAAAFATTPEGMPYEQFDLRGWAELVEIRIERDGFREPRARSHYTITLADGEIAYQRFPLHVRGLHGTVVSRELEADRSGRSARIIEFNALEGEAIDGGRIHGRGMVLQPAEGRQKIEIRIDGEGILLGPDMGAALEASASPESGMRELWERLRPHGAVNAQVLLTGPDTAEVTVDLAGTAGFDGYAGIDCPVTDLEGKITYREDQVLFDSVRGALGEATILFDGKLQPGGSLDLSANVRALALDAPLRALVGKLAPEITPILDRVDPTPDSWVDLSIKVTRRSARQPLVIEAEVPRLGIHTEVRGLAVSVSGGPLLIDGDHLVAKDLWFRTGESVVRLREARLPREEGRFGWLLLDASALHPVEHLQRFLGPGFSSALGENLRVDLKDLRAEFNRGDGTVILSGAIDLHRATVPEETSPLLEPTGALSFSPLTLRLPQHDGEEVTFSGVIEYRGLNLNIPIDVRDMSGELRVAEGRGGEHLLLRGAISGGSFTLYERTFDHVSLNLEYDGDHLRLGNLDARFYEGTLRGNVEAHLAAPGGFLVELRATDVNLQNLLKRDLPRDEPLTGTLDFALDLRSPRGKVHEMEGRGEVRIREGQLFELPGMRAILSVLGRVTPLNVPRFRTMEVDFDVNGEQLALTRFHIGTPVNDVYATGTVSIYGDLDLVVEPQVTRILDLPRLFNFPVLSTLRSLWHRTVYEIRLEGTVDSPALRLRALPWLKNTRTAFTQSPHAGRAERMRPRILP